MRNRLMRALQQFSANQRRLSGRIDSLLPERFRVDGMQDFLRTTCRRHLQSGQHLYDVGGGKNPFIDLPTKEGLNLKVTGIDISRDELLRAPAGSYDETVTSDIAQYRGSGDGDIAVSSAVFEHVRDVRGAFEALNSILAPGGKALIFVPSRNALFARLNLILPEAIKRRGLTIVRGQTNDDEGFPSFYSECTPRQFGQMAEECGFTVAEERLYYISSYFFSLLPFYLMWRAWILMFYGIDRRQSAESFSVVLVKR